MKIEISNIYNYYKFYHHYYNFHYKMRFPQRTISSGAYYVYYRLRDATMYHRIKLSYSS